MKKVNYPKQYHLKKGLILQAYSYACLGCGLISADLQIHHLDKNIFNNSSFNLIPLCSHCHNLAHKLKIKFTIPVDPDFVTKLKALNDFDGLF